MWYIVVVSAWPSWGAAFSKVFSFIVYAKDAQQAEMLATSDFNAYTVEQVIECTATCRPRMVHDECW